MDRTKQHEQAAAFRLLHQPGDPLVLVNIWDVGSARAVAEAGAPALATSSWSVARARGYDDGEQIPLDEVTALVRAVVSNVELPLTVDLESGYGAAPDTVGATVGAAIDAGAIGCNLEDSRPDRDDLLPPAEQAPRLRAARLAADEAGIPAFINARTDVFLRAPEAGTAGLDEVLERAAAYADAGADSIFVPGLTDVGLVSVLVKKSPLPVSVMVDPRSNLDALAVAGVARISYGASSYLAAMKALSTLGHHRDPV